jgi:hypothetical protein
LLRQSPGVQVAAGAPLGPDYVPQSRGVMLQTEMDKSFENAILLWPFLKGICYGKAAQAF